MIFGITSMDIKEFLSLLALIILRVFILAITIVIMFLGLIICFPSREFRRELFRTLNDGK